MSKKVWIINHYAGNMFVIGGGRHYYIAKYLKEYDYDPIVFCSNYDHFTHRDCVENNGLFIEKIEAETNVPYVFVRTRKYSNNGIKRILNMIDFYHGMLKTAQQYAKEHGHPDVIYASSVHPLTLVAGIKIAKQFGIKCISEVRDLWPESIVAYSAKLKRTNPVMKALYKGEKWIYKKSDYIIMTWPGGYDYIAEQGWEQTIPESKVIHISNGVDLNSFVTNIREHPFQDCDLDDPQIKSFVYTGSVRKVNNLKMLVKAAEILKQRNNRTARIIVFGDGDELEALKTETRNNRLDNIVFKGRVSKQYIPSILSKCYVSILHNSSTALDKYGQSQNKFFEYLAAGRPVLMTYSVGHSVIRNNACGIELDSQTPEAIAEAIIQLCDLPMEKYQEYRDNAINCSKKYAYSVLSKHLSEVIDQCIVTEGTQVK